MNEFKLAKESRSLKPEPRKGHSSAILNNNMIVIGGIAEDEVYKGDIWRLDLSRLLGDS